MGTPADFPGLAECYPAAAWEFFRLVADSAPPDRSGVVRPVASVARRGRRSGSKQKAKP